jgi:hypothetical protein
MLYDLTYAESWICVSENNPSRIRGEQRPTR